MSTEISQITVGDLSVDVVRKDIKNLHLGVYPPAGRIRVAAPLAVGDDVVRLAVIGKLGWIKRQRAKFDAQPRQSRREMVGGESHYVLGRRYRLRLHVYDGPPSIALSGNAWLDLTMRPGTTSAQREQILCRWYRDQLKTLLPPLLDRWQPILGVQVAAWGVRRMKTRWGSCNIPARRVWFNLELAKKPQQCIEYVVVHELAHLLERRHDDRFTALLDRHLPNWRTLRDILNRAPLGHDDFAGPTAPPPLTGVVPG